MMSHRVSRATESQTKTALVRQPEQGPVQQAAPQTAYRRAQVNRNGLTATALLALQRTVGNRQVQRMLMQCIGRANGQQQNTLSEERLGIKIQTRLTDGAPDQMRATIAPLTATASQILRKGPKVSKPKPPDYYKDTDNTIKYQDQSGAWTVVGLCEGENCLVTADNSPLFPLTTSQVGILDNGNATTIPIVDMKLVKLQPVQSDAPTELTGYRRTYTGSRIGILFQDKKPGATILTGNNPTAPDKLPDDLRAKLTPGADIDLKDGRFWVLMTFRLKGETKDTTRWVPSGHSMKEYQTHERELSTETEKLPENLKAQVEENLKIIALVSTHEGSFGAKSPSGDVAASLGIFQWAMQKQKTERGSSLGQFFHNLKVRAEDAKKTEVSKRTAEQKLYVDAWEQCTDQGLDVSGGKISLKGKEATGAEVEALLGGKQGAMAKDALRTYQLVAALDWIKEFKGVIVRPGPGPIGAQFIGHGYKDVAAGRKAILKWKVKPANYTIELTAPDNYATVGTLFTLEKSLAMAVMLGVNRPHFVETALWRSLNPAGDPKTEAEGHLQSLVDKQTQPIHEQIEILAARATELSRQLKAIKKAKEKHALNVQLKSVNQAIASQRKRLTGTITFDQVLDSAKESYQALQKLIWPQATALNAAAEAQLAREFQSQAMQLYKPRDAKKFKREQRFATVEAAFESPYW
jgi:hypothetical protein